MSKVIDVRGSGGELVVLGKAFVLPASTDNSTTPAPLNGSIRFNSTDGTMELYFGGAWSAVAGQGGYSPHTHTISQVFGLQEALDDKSNVGHSHVLSEVEGLVAGLEGKSDVGHVHTTSDVTGLDTAISDINTAISGKAATVHTHVIADTTGLQAALDGKAPLTHTHAITDVTGLSADLVLAKRETFAVCLPGAAPTGYKFIWTAPFSVTFDDDFAGAQGSVQSDPASDYVISVSKNGAPIGAITCTTSGSVTFATSGSGTVVVSAGQTLEFTCPTKDLSIDGLSFTLVGAGA